MYRSILITVSQEWDSNLHMQGCQVCTVPFWSQYHKTGILTYICRGVRYVLFILITVSQEGDSNLHMQGCQVCTVPFWSVSQEGDSNLHMQGCQVIPSLTYSRGVRYVLFHSEYSIRYVLFHSDHSITRRGFSGVNLHMQGCQVCTVPFWSQYHKKGILTYICRGVRYVLFHSDHSITRRGF